MGSIYLPDVRKHIENQNENLIIQHYAQGLFLDNVNLLSREPFVVTSNEINYLLTSNENFDIPNEYEYALLVTKKKKNKDLENGSIKVKRWLKHPKFKNLLPDEVI